MLVGIPKEVKTEEYRVGLTPYSVQEVVSHGHQVILEHNAGDAINFTDEAYRAAGATIVDTPEVLFRQAEMIIKVKEPQLSEYNLLREGQILFTYLHLAPDPQQAQALIKSGCIAIAYETVTSKEGGLPLLFPMSQVAGRLAIQAGAHCLETPSGGSGILLGGVPGVYPGKVTVIGGGVVGTNAIRMAINKKTQVTVLDKSLRRLQELYSQFGGHLNTVYSTENSIEQCIIDADLVVGAVLVPGQSAPRLVPQEVLKRMRPGSVMVDVAIDQGGCFQTSRPTTHKAPTYVVDGIVHYCVTNMPGAVPRTSTLALSNATLPFVIALADKGYRKALLDDPHLRNGLNICLGYITHEGVARDLKQLFVPALELLY
ncbi:alanine dehydrogenase [Coxiella endosymbiont of Amblyomma nuttalli]|uniref:alanine dehydrogenase n=1 Tax=Coxiella endosymbiont of Amblyomma nuttalli TaxID=2749996 RepID=UPI001BA91436|nr:alanine dehydrogenase [Coxiella endosymbiont of Amblyomma nuttalli]QTS83947.1 Alanine dehydrogenase [Coxiella endosymbiont of Amblyomma nuttalli]